MDELDVPLFLAEPISFQYIQDQLAEDRFSLEQCHERDEAYWRGRVDALEEMLIQYEVGA